MRTRRTRALRWGTAAALAAGVAVAGCSKAAPKNAPVSPPGTTKAAAIPGVVATSPAGVTTKIDVPAHSTEEEYFQACHAATVWMQDHPGDHQTVVERYLAAVQRPGIVGPGTWNVGWAALTLPRQAGVIVAATAAAAGECG